MFNRNMDSVLVAKGSGEIGTFADPEKVAKLKAKRTRLITQYKLQDEQAKDKYIPTKAKVSSQNTNNIKLTEHTSKPITSKLSTLNLFVAFSISLIIAVAVAILH
ncbi:hypothetical protein MHN00_20340 [Alteromonas sp. Cnat2-8]|uniref:hypothetical protein n=1 Tax=Alteromonas sp. Cnat2-8 TaxID=2917728 RepID=UPI001EF66A59|nr:hypothetical protein [Alteromonas sp. Cnat2-8]MCG7655894.1 hypothetical protein [Alteromonas sp. Cnat2-8]|tara:strand:+ start:14 stop:328 length:315 start_codon:yes stop_codon:yes gene_type:complete